MVNVNPLTIWQFQFLVQIPFACCYCSFLDCYNCVIYQCEKWAMKCNSPELTWTAAKGIQCAQRRAVSMETKSFEQDLGIPGLQCVSRCQALVSRLISDMSCQVPWASPLTSLGLKTLLSLSRRSQFYSVFTRLWNISDQLYVSCS